MKVDIKASEIKKMANRYIEDVNETDEKILNEFGRQFINIEGYQLDSTGAIYPVLMVPEGFTIATSNPVISSTSCVKCFKDIESDLCVYVTINTINVKRISADLINLNTSCKEYEFFSTIDFVIDIANVVNFKTRKYISSEDVIKAWNGQEYKEKCTIPELVDGYFEAEDMKRKCNDKLREHAEKFIVVKDWKIVKQKDKIYRVFPVLETPDGYTMEGTGDINEVSKDQDVIFVKKDDKGNIVECIKVAVNISGTETIRAQQVKNVDSGKPFVDENSVLFCNSMRFKVVFVGKDNKQTMRHEIRKVVMREDVLIAICNELGRI